MTTQAATTNVFLGLRGMPNKIRRPLVRAYHLEHPVNKRMFERRRTLKGTKIVSFFKDPGSWGTRSVDLKHDLTPAETPRDLSLNNDLLVGKRAERNRGVGRDSAFGTCATVDYARESRVDPCSGIIELVVPQRRPFVSVSYLNKYLSALNAKSNHLAGSGNECELDQKNRILYKVLVRDLKKRFNTLSPLRFSVRSIIRLYKQVGDLSLSNVQVTDIHKYLKDQEVTSPETTLLLPTSRAGYRHTLFGRVVLNRQLKRDFVKELYVPDSFSNRGSTNLARPPPFLIASRGLKKAEDQMLVVVSDYRSKKVTLANAVDAVNIRDDHNNLAFREFARALGCKVADSVVFSKKIANDALEECLGSSRKRASRRFVYPGIGVPEENHVAIAFSLYMGKKVYAPGNPLEPPDLNEYLKTMTTPPRPLPRRFITFFTRLFSYLCRKPKDFSWDKLPPLTSPKSCIESTSMEGGKRAFHYESSETFFPDTRAVIPKIIYTGGKYRTVTISSAACDKFHAFNDLMGKRIRRFKSSIFGREIEEWVTDVSPYIRSLEGDQLFVSGDLKSATDLLNGQIMKIACDELVSQFNLDNEEEDLLRGYSYQARYYKRAGLEVEKIVCCGCHQPFRCEHFVTQQGGINMGSDPSFPVLCATSLAIIMDAHGDLEYANRIVDSKKFIEFVSSWDKGGFNGDDIVAIGLQGIEEKWKSSVECCNGEPEMSKSPLSPIYATVNSALFEWNDLRGTLERVVTVHPGKVHSVLSGAAKSPDRHWQELLKCPQDWSRKLALDVAMRPQIPTQLGGTGLSTPRRSTTTAQSLLLSLISRPIFNFETTAYKNYGISNPKSECRRVPGYISVDKRLWLEHVQDRYRSKGSIFWSSDPTKISVTDDDIQRIVTLTEDKQVVDECFEVCKLYESQEKEGRIVLHDASIPLTFPFEPIKIPQITGFRMDKRIVVQEEVPDVIKNFKLPEFQIEQWSDKERGIIEGRIKVEEDPEAWGSEWKEEGEINTQITWGKKINKKKTSSGKWPSAQGDNSQEATLTQTREERKERWKNLDKKKRVS